MSDTRSAQAGNIALLIDADNASSEHLDAVLTILAELGTVNIRRAYGNWSKAALKGWAEMTHRHAIEPHQQFDITKGKNATDMKMTIDAMDLLFGGRVDGFGIMSSDSDFMPLAMRIRQDGVPVYGFGTSRAPVSFQQACSRFIDVAALVQGDENDAPEAAPPAPKRKVDEELVKLLGAAFRASKRDGRGYASLSEVGQRAGNRSSFDARSYGYAGLHELIDAVPNFATERREDGKVYVKRVRKGGISSSPRPPGRRLDSRVRGNGGRRTRRNARRGSGKRRPAPRSPEACETTPPVRFASPVSFASFDGDRGGRTTGMTRSRRSVARRLVRRSSAWLASFAHRPDSGRIRGLVDEGEQVKNIR